MGDRYFISSLPLEIEEIERVVRGLDRVVAEYIKVDRNWKQDLKFEKEAVCNWHKSRKIPGANSLF